MEKPKRLPRGLAEERILKALRSACADRGRTLSLAELGEQTELSRGTVQEVITRLKKTGQVETRRDCPSAPGPKVLGVALKDPRSARSS